MIQTTSYPRAAVIGNPSDGYHGKTIAFVFDDYKSTAEISAHDRLEISDEEGNMLTFADCSDLAIFIAQHGYGHPSIGNLKLAIATIHHLYQANLIASSKTIIPTFQIKFTSDIPRSLGLAGSSAIIAAIVNAIYQFNNLKVNKSVLPNTILNVETEELGISAGLQDRVAQVYAQPIFMDFDKSIIDKTGSGRYEPIEGLTNLNWYIAFPTRLSESSDISHSTLRSRYDSGDEKVVSAMKGFADLTIRFKAAIASNNIKSANLLINRNFDLRKSIMTVNPLFADIVMLARSTGASAKFTGSGGAIIGLYKNDLQYDQLKHLMSKNNIQTFKPRIVLK